MRLIFTGLSPLIAVREKMASRRMADCVHFTQDEAGEQGRRMSLAGTTAFADCLKLFTKLRHSLQGCGVTPPACGCARGGRRGRAGGPEAGSTTATATS